MRELMSSFLSNDSAFGRAMTWCGVVIGANIMFFVFSLPVVTYGASYAALQFTIMRAKRSGGQINPFREFWKGFRTNWKKATIVFAAGAALAFFLYIDIRIASRAGGVIGMWKIPLTALLFAEAVFLIWLFPVMAAFDDPLPQLCKNSFLFILRGIWKIPILLFFHLFPFYLSYTDVQLQPLYAFIWAFFGFSLIALLDANLILPDFLPYLPVVDEYGDMVLEPDPETGFREPEEETSGDGQPAGAPDLAAAQKSEKEILEEMRRLGM